MTTLYLKKNVVLEPLCWNWYAWSHLIYPVTAAMHIAYRHIPIMERFLVNANERLSVQNQKFESGPIVQLDQTRVGEVAALLERTRQSQAPLLRMAEGIRAASALVEAARGRTLEPVYDQLAPEIKGLVELVYDIDFSAGLRYIEPLVYQDTYSTSGQCVAFSHVDSDQRPFILGTPRLPDQHNFHLACAFDAPALDAVFRSQTEGIDRSALLDLFAVSGARAEQLLGYFDATPPAPPAGRHVDGPGVRARYFGHACVLLQTREVNVLVDPLISYSYDSDIARFTHDDLPDVLDYVIVTHAHQDHFSLENLLKIRHRTRHVVIARNAKGNIADPSMKRVLHKLGFGSVIEVDELDMIEIAGGTILAVPFLGEHAELDVQTKMAYSVTLAGKNFLFAADANNFDNAVYERVFRDRPPVDVLFIGMECDGGPLNWLYGPLITRAHDKDATRTRTLSGSDFPKASRLVEQCGCSEAYVYSMGQEPWLNYIMNINYTKESLQLIESDKFVAACNAGGIKSARLFGKAEMLYGDALYGDALYGDPQDRARDAARAPTGSAG